MGSKEDQGLQRGEALGTNSRREGLLCLEVPRRMRGLDKWMGHVRDPALGEKAPGPGAREGALGSSPMGHLPPGQGKDS